MPRLIYESKKRAERCRIDIATGSGWVKDRKKSPNARRLLLCLYRFNKIKPQHFIFLCREFHQMIKMATFTEVSSYLNIIYTILTLIHFT